MNSIHFFDCSCDGRGGNTVKRNDACHELQFPEYRDDFSVKGGVVVIVEGWAIGTGRGELGLWVHRIKMLGEIFYKNIFVLIRGLEPRFPA